MIERIKEIIKEVEQMPGTKLSSLDKQNAMINAYEDIRDLVFKWEEVLEMREVKE